MAAVYYEDEKQIELLNSAFRVNLKGKKLPDVSWDGYLLEADTLGVLHFHLYTFGFPSDDSEHLQIKQHSHYQMPILDFFDCRYV